MNKLMKARLLGFIVAIAGLAFTGAGAGVLINGNQINPQTAISISSMTVSGTGGETITSTLTVNGGSGTNPSVATASGVVVNAGEVNAPWFKATNVPGYIGDLSEGSGLPAATGLTGQVPIANGGTNLSGAGGTANRVMRTSNGTTYAMGQIIGPDVTGSTLPLNSLNQSGATDGQVAQWVNADSAWEPKTPSALVGPTSAYFTAGTNYYTPSPGTVYWACDCQAGGGAGGGISSSGGTAGAQGGNCSINITGTAITAVGGFGGPGAGATTAPAQGGSGGAGVVDWRHPGNGSSGGSFYGDGTTDRYSAGGGGGCGGGGAASNANITVAGHAGVSQSGGGGSGGGFSGSGTSGGGGGGECFELTRSTAAVAIITVPGTTTGGAGTYAGGDGASGYAFCREYHHY